MLKTLFRPTAIAMNFLVLLGLLSGLAPCLSTVKEELIAYDYLEKLSEELARQTNLETEASWAFASNITEANERRKNELAAEVAKFMKDVAEDLKKFNWKTYESADLRRQFRMLSKLGYAALPADDYAALLEAISSMESNFAKVKVCDYKDSSKCDLSLEPEIEEIISKSRDPEELKHYWVEFYKKAGAPTRPAFERYIELNRQAAKLNNFTSGAEMWLDEYEDPTIEHQLETIYNEIKPLYDQIHGYVRHRLVKRYGKDVVSETGPIPMHLLGNMWAQQWSDIADIITPYPEKPLVDVTEEMLRQGYTPLKMFQMGDEFFTSMNLTKLPQQFWDKSILTKPTDGRDMICHASAWDFFLVDDVRIKQCTRVTQEQFFVVHHELGHIQYYLQYQHLPFVYRTGANPGFHEAVGDVLSLSVSTPRHLEKVGLLKNYVHDEESRINQLFLKALDKIVFLPFAFTMDKYRWALFRGQVDKSNWNCAFWKLREEYSGIEPPVVRSENDFDPPAKYHVSADVEYLRYLVSFIIQFQFYKSACVNAGQYKPNDPQFALDNCDIYGSAEAGAAFHKMLSLGASKPWPDALEVFNGERAMTGKAIAEYFAPLQVWLEAENKKNNVRIGWTKSKKCVSTRTE